MKKLFVNLVLVSSLIGCSKHSTSLSSIKQLRNPEGLSHQYTYSDVTSQSYLSFKAKLKEFAIKFADSFNKHYGHKDNVLCSPLSVELCLGLAIRSSSNKTKEELINAFGIDESTFNQYYKLFFNELYHTIVNDDNQLVSQLLLTNSIWFDNDVLLNENTLDALRDDYYCYSYEVDFNRDNKKSNEAIENFINEQTKGLIKPHLELSPLTYFVLMNTLYLKDLWNESGDELSTTIDKYKFVNYDKSQIDINLLSGYYFDGKTLTTDSYSSFYTTTNKGVKIYFMKPNDGYDIKDIFNKENISYMLGNNFIYTDDVLMERYHTRCLFPEFKGDGDEDIIELLKDDFQIQTLFDERCDFSTICNDDVFCSEVKHIAKLEVNKKGIEGAAVTYMALAGASAPVTDPYKDVYETFIVDQAFGYVVTYKDAILFSGITTNIK